MTSESTTSGKDEAPAIDMAELGARITAHRAALGIPDLPRNSGTHRTPSKKPPLKAIEAVGGKW